MFGISLSGSLFHEAQGTIDVWLEWQPKSSRGLVCIWPFTWVQIQAQVFMFAQQVLYRVNHLPSPMCSTWMTLCYMWFGTIRDWHTNACMFISLECSLDGIVGLDRTRCVYLIPVDSARECKVCSIMVLDLLYFFF